MPAAAPIAEQIRTRLGECSPAERKVARVLLANWPAAGFETVATLAERATVSAPTVLRLVTRLGYRGFPDFQAALRTELDERNASPLTLFTTSGEDADAQSGLLQRASTAFVTAIGRTLAELPQHDLDRAIELLADPKRRIILAGGRFTQLFAHYLGMHLMQLRDDVRFLPDRDVERTAVLAALGRRDVLVVFDHRRYEPDKVAIAQLAQEHGGRVILFTDTWLSPVAAHAEVVLPSQVTSPSPYDSLAPTLAVTETVIAGVLNTLGDQGHQRMQEREDIAKTLGLY
ncbi:MurR/RpiR family transcriptional regulator [Kitasatospora sp. NPDC101801]|uniref:MurR/RpiR family transcriptional regulator n=1 Tax=Kitasatospora sp. NPDC101801 TaxID=3364103 RepID=UPI0038081BDB